MTSGTLVDILIISVGKPKNSSLKEEISIYTKRLGRHAKLDIIYVKDVGTPEREAESILSHLGKAKDRFVVALSEEGKGYTSREFESLLSNHGPKFTFVIGGPTGLGQRVKNAASTTLSLSPMTFTHEMAAYLLVEQLYRAMSIRLNSKYHKD